ncbi:MAG: LysM repeat protein [Myxococcota bacterium]|jgi:LysM repeat protein
MSWTTRAYWVALLASLTLLFAGSAAATEGYETTYVVKRGDNLSKIAKRLDVSVKQIKRWNRLRSNRIRKGQKLTIYSLTPERPTRIVEHRIRRGDTLTKIAKKYNTSIKALKKLNRKLRRRRPRIIAGRILKVEIPGPENPSESTGRPQYGRLTNGERLPKGPGYIVKSPGRAYGTNHTVTLLMTTIPKVLKKWRRAPKVVIGDLSKKQGGHFPPHRSHQNGLDADIGYYHKTKPHPTDFRRANARTLDVEKTWFLLLAFLKTGQVDYIFVDYSLQKVLYKYAKKKGAKKRWLDETFQYPRSKHTTKGTIRHSPSHKNHFHIRFKDFDPKQVHSHAPTAPAALAEPLVGRG